LLQITGEIMSTTDIKEVVKEKYGQIALNVLKNDEQVSCCNKSACCGADADPITSDLYDSSQTDHIPETP
jgi:hypothetical protein